MALLELENLHDFLYFYLFFLGLKRISVVLFNKAWKSSCHIPMAATFFSNIQIRISSLEYCLSLVNVLYELFKKKNRHTYIHT